MFRTVHRLGLGINRNLDDGITCYEDETTNLNTYAGYDDFAEFILRFPQVYHVALVSNQLMSGADDIDNINDDCRSEFILDCWDDWVGRVDGDVISSPCEGAKIVTKDDYEMVINEFAGAMNDLV